MPRTAGALAVARGALAQARQPGARRPRAAARRPGRTARAAPSRCRSTPTTRPTSCATAASRSAACRWGQYGNRVGVPRILRAPGEARRQGDASTCRPSTALLYPDEQRARGRRRPRDRHPRLDPRAQLGAAARGRARPDACAPPTRWRRSPASGRSACARRRGTSARNTLAHRRRRWACSTTPR